jgi:hypothetical protein
MIRGMAVLTIVWSNDARNRASITPVIVMTTCRFGNGGKPIFLVFNFTLHTSIPSGLSPNNCLKIVPHPESELSLYLVIA